jgi:alkyl hydroperoxide reductase subunit AhpC
MAVRLGDTAPDFTAPTTQGEISFHEWLGDSWGVLFSHPKDFTPVCTTELGYVAKIKPEFDKRNVKVIGLSVDPVESHVAWEGDIEETQGTAVNFPMIGDPDRTVADLYDMIHENASDTLTVRSVFVIGPDKKVKLTLTYPAIDRAQLRRDPPGDRQPAAHRRLQGGHPGQLDRRRGRHHRPGDLRRRGQGAVPRRLEPRQAVPPRHQATQPLTRPGNPRIRNVALRLR